MLGRTAESTFFQNLELRWLRRQLINPSILKLQKSMEDSSKQSKWNSRLFDSHLWMLIHVWYRVENSNTFQNCFTSMYYAALHLGAFFYNLCPLHLNRCVFLSFCLVWYLTHQLKIVFKITFLWKKTLLNVRFHEFFVRLKKTRNGLQNTLILNKTKKL